MHRSSSHNDCTHSFCFLMKKMRAWGEVFVSWFWGFKIKAPTKTRACLNIHPCNKCSTDRQSPWESHTGCRPTIEMQPHKHTLQVVRRVSFRGFRHPLRILRQFYMQTRARCQVSMESSQRNPAYFIKNQHCLICTILKFGSILVRKVKFLHPVSTGFIKNAMFHSRPEERHQICSMKVSYPKSIVLKTTL